MNLFRVITELPPTARWYAGRLSSAIIYSRAFALFGKGSTIVSPLKLKGTERIRIGNDCAIYEGCWLEAEPSGTLSIGDSVYLGHDVHLHAVDDVEIGDGCMFADGVLVSAGGHDPLAEMAVTHTGRIRIGHNVFIGQRAMVLGGVTIGDGAIVGAGAVVTRDVPAGETVAGIPARSVRGTTHDEQSRQVGTTA